MPKISIINPVYNAEKYLKETLDSYVERTKNGIEILLIVDYFVNIRKSATVI